MTTFTQMCIIKQLGLAVKSLLCFYTKTTSKRTLKLYLFSTNSTAPKNYENTKTKTSKPCMWDFTVFLDQFSP